MPGAPLELHEREEIFRALVEDLQAGWAAIGRRVGRHPTTVAREINAGGGRERLRAGGGAAARRGGAATGAAAPLGGAGAAAGPHLRRVAPGAFPRGDPRGPRRGGRGGAAVRRDRLPGALQRCPGRETR